MNQVWGKSDSLDTLLVSEDNTDSGLGFLIVLFFVFVSRTSPS